MIKIYLDGTNFLVNYNDVCKITLSPEEFYHFMINRLNVELSELYIAVDEMQKNGHNYAEFGVNRMFVYTQLREMPASSMKSCNCEGHKTNSAGHSLYCDCYKLISA
jgi:hypothetical protein